jgi:hypothetical protein
LRAGAGPLGGRLSWLHVRAVVPLAAFSLAPPAVVIFVVYLVVGLLSGARDMLNQLAVQAGTPADGLAEAFSWLPTLMWGGYGLRHPHRRAIQVR